MNDNNGFQNQMTTIAWDGKTLAADSGVFTDTDLICPPQNKIEIVRNTLIACAGNEDEGNIFVRWYKAGAKFSKFREAENSFEAIIVNKRGAFTNNGKPVFNRLNRGEKWAIGSGGDMAMALMAGGKSAPEAVALVSKIHVFSRPPVTTARFDDTGEIIQGVWDE